MNTARSIAHVCTTADAPAAARAGVYLVEAAECHDKAQLLLHKYRTLKDSDYRDALWHGYWALKQKAEGDFAQVIKCGALLHYCNPKAAAVADEASRIDLQDVLSGLEATTC